MKKKPSILELIKKRVVILDGAMGSMLIAQGLQPGTPSENWNLSNPLKIKEIQKSYFDSGSDAVLTNTFGGTRIKLEAHKQGNRCEEYNKKAVEIAREICPEDCYVAGDIGPTGVFLPPVGKATIELFKENYLEQAKILANEGVDFFFVETMVDIKEAETAVKAIKKVSNLPIMASMTYQKTKKDYFTIMGNDVKSCVQSLVKSGADVIGANCTITSSEIIDLVPILRELTDKPISIKPNAGKPQLKEEKIVYPVTPDEFAQDIKKIVEYKARVIGGCCGTNPLFIERIARIFKR